MDIEVKKHELKVILKNILKISQVDELVAKQLKISTSMLSKIKNGDRYENNPIKMQEVINAYRKVYNNQNNKIQK